MVMVNESFISCYYFLLLVNIVFYRLDVKISIVIVFICVFIGLVCFCVIVLNLMVFLGVLRKFDFCNVYNILILFFVIFDFLVGLIILLLFVVY